MPIQVGGMERAEKCIDQNPLDDKSGSTAISCLIDSERIFFLNVGDSRAILVSTDARILLATKDHKPSTVGSFQWKFVSNR